MAISAFCHNFFLVKTECSDILVALAEGSMRCALVKAISYQELAEQYRAEQVIAFGKVVRVAVDNHVSFGIEEQSRLWYAHAGLARFVGLEVVIMFRPEVARIDVITFNDSQHLGTLEVGPGEA